MAVQLQPSRRMCKIWRSYSGEYRLCLVFALLSAESVEYADRVHGTDQPLLQPARHWIVNCCFTCRGVGQRYRRSVLDSAACRPTYPESNCAPSR